MIIWGLLLFWFALTGGYVGLNTPVLLYINVLLWLVLLVVATKNKRPLDLIDLSLLAMSAAAAISAVYHQSSPFKFGEWLGFWAIYRLNPIPHINRAALLALVAYLPAALLQYEYDSPNVIAYNLVFLALLSLPALGGQWWLIGIVAGLVFYPLNSLGGLLALVVAGTIYLAHYIQHRWPFVLAAGPIIASYFFDLSSFNFRISMAVLSLQAALINPILGVGPGKFYTTPPGKFLSIPKGWSHGHNIICTVAVETGLLGLTALGLLVWAVIKKWPLLPIWSRAAVGALAAWSMVDEPLYFLASGVIFALCLGGHYDKQIN
jgi:hypothetical protein